jgi:hypothetical protein
MSLMELDSIAALRTDQTTPAMNRPPPRTRQPGIPPMEPDSESDPFGERARARFRKTMTLLGARVRFDSDSRGLLALAVAAFGRLPAHRLPLRAQQRTQPRAPLLRISLRLAPPPRSPAPSTRRAGRASEPAPLQLVHGAGVIGGVSESAALVLIAPRERAALVRVPAQDLHHGYHTRYELIEFAVFALAARVLGLVSVHGACVGRKGRGVLLLGPSGAGKSTLMLHAALRGLDFLSEDSVFIEPASLLATGAANFLHLRADSLRWLRDPVQTAAIRESPIIRRRSGVEKFEIDLRRKPFRLARQPLAIEAVVFLSARPPGARALLQPLSTAQCRRRFAATQAYAASQPQWRTLSRNLRRLKAYEMRRPRHPEEAAAALQSCLGG